MRACLKYLTVVDYPVTRSTNGASRDKDSSFIFDYETFREIIPQGNENDRKAHCPVQQVTCELNIDHAYGGLIPEDKVNHLKAKQHSQFVGLVGDDVNDAPVAAISAVGIAMGGLGSDAIIEKRIWLFKTTNRDRIPIAIRMGKTHCLAE